ncbi:MAG: hypothetical protein ACERLG_09375 [Sedimentibacter sp.]
MDYIIVILLIVIFFIGFVFIDKIYSIAKPVESTIPVFYPTYPNNISNDVLIYGDSDFCIDISNILEQNRLHSEILYDINNLDKSCSYNLLIAVSKSDLDNLTICAIGTKMMGIKKVLSLCNQQYNKKIYEENSIPYLCNSSISASDIALTLLKIS